MQNYRRLRTAIVVSLAQHLLFLRNRHFALIDLLIFLITPAIALYLRTDSLASLANHAPALLLYTGLAVILRMSIYYLFGIYQRYWRFVSTVDFAALLLATSVALLFTVANFLLLHMALDSFALPRSVPLLDAMLAFLLTAGVRVTLRLSENLRARAAVPRPMGVAGRRQRTLIVGAGYTGALLAREIRDNAQIHIRPIGFIDDDPYKQRIQIHNLPVLGTHEELPALITKYQIDRVIIAMPSATGKIIRKIVGLCQRAQVSVQTMPGVHELINGNVSVNKLRNVQIEDLLRRTAIETDIAAVGRLLEGKRVLVTGGGGSIGSELCRQILRCSPSQLILVGHGENSIFEIQQELQQWLAEESAADSRPISTILTPIIADLRLQRRVNGIFDTLAPEIVFHAAAHKHVPLMESNPVEAITNNILGTRNLLEASQVHGVERFVMISTDKAVNPTNVMGASKRIAELLVLAAAHRHGHFYQVVRFGNVLGSRGSVIHTFKKQIARGGPVMVTHPEMVRYFMTIPEAVQLVLQASVLGHGAEVLMLDMGDPVRIVDLARDLIELSGLEVGSDIEIAFSGLRPGEKLFEEMFQSAELYKRTEHEKIFIAPNAAQILPTELESAVEYLIVAALNNDETAALQMLCRLLPEYQPWPNHKLPTQRTTAQADHLDEDKSHYTVRPSQLRFNGAVGD